ncbi:MAG: type I polyketide synthase [Pseudomonadota bacterium]
MRRTSRAGSSLPRETNGAMGDGASAVPPGRAPATGAPLAITALACRLPGAPDVAAFWKLLREERHAIGRLPEDRWSSAKFLRPGGPARGRTYTNAAGVIDDLWDFDAGFFGISPREAAQMDPQQRMMLEVAWRAVEAALPLGGPLHAPGRPGGFGRTGVYVGASTMDHAQRFATDIASIDSPFMTGNTLSIISNRISQSFGYDGPSLTVDTACASGLTALHLAAEALRSGEIDTAVVGAVNALLQPWNFVGFSQAAMLSPRGLCRAFDADADGYVRAEGAVALVLRRLEDAEAGGEPLRGVLRASGISSDGLKRGLSRPETAGQAALLRRVHAEAGLPPERLAFIEAHGTGTAVGDPVEAAAIAGALGDARCAAGLDPLPIGSAKSNVGHLEPAAGLVGLLKATLALEHGILPPTLHVARVNPEVARHEALVVARESQTLGARADGAPHAAGVSAFGFGGANAHAVLEAPPLSAAPRGAAAETALKAATLPPLVLSAETEAGLRQLATDWRKRLADIPVSPDAARSCAGSSAEEQAHAMDMAAGQDLGRLLAAAGHRVSLRRERAVILADGSEALDRALAAVAEEAAETLPVLRAASVVRGCAGAGAVLAAENDGLVASPSAVPGAPVGFLFAGNGAQWAGMGEALFATDATYARAFERAGEALAAAGGSDPRALRVDPALSDRLTESGPAQAFLFALQVGLVECLVAAGVRPAAVLGHSVGEVTAAWAAGALTLEDAARIVALRARAVAPLHGTGTMAALLATPEGALALVEDAGLMAEVGLAAVNSPQSVTVSGTTAGIDALSKAARRARVACRKLPVPYPYHSAHMALIRAPLLDGLADLAPLACRGTSLFSSVTGGRFAGPGEDRPAPLDAMHWWRNAREPVQFWSAAEAMAAAGVGYFVEIGPRPVLAGYLRELRAAGAERALPCAAAMEGPGREGPSPKEVAAAALASGAAVDRTFLGPVDAALPIPSTPLDRRRHQAALGPEAIDLFGLEAEATAPGTQDRPATAPWLLGLRDRPGAGPWQARLDPSLHPWLGEHRVDEHPVLPAAAFAAIAVAAARETGQRGPVEIDGLDIIAPLGLSAAGVALRTSFDDTTSGLTIESRPHGSALPWQAHARASLCRAPAPGAGVAIAAMMKSGHGIPDEASPAHRRDVDPVRLYDDLSLAGLDYGPRFRLLQQCRVEREGPEGALVSAIVGASPSALDAEGPVDGGSGSLFRGTISPMMLDASFHALAALLDTTAGQATWLPRRMARLWFGGDAPVPGSPWHVVARLRARRATWILADIVVSTQGSDPFLAVEGLSLEARPQPGLSDVEDWRETWVPLSPPPMPRRPAEEAGIAETLRRAGHWLAEEPAPDAALLLEELCRHAIAETLGTDAPGGRCGPLRAALKARDADRSEADPSCTGAPPAGADDLIPVDEIVPRLLAVRPDAAVALLGALALPETLRSALDDEAKEASEERGGLLAGPLTCSMAVAPLLGALTRLFEDCGAGAARPRALLFGAEEGLALPFPSAADWFELVGSDASRLAPGGEAGGTAAGADLVIWLAGFGNEAAGHARAVECLSSEGDFLTVVLPAPGSVFPETGAVEAAAHALRDAGMANVETGWFDAGTHVLGLVSARRQEDARAAVPADMPAVLEILAEAIVLLHDPAEGAHRSATVLAAADIRAEIRPLTAPGCVKGRDVAVLAPRATGPLEARQAIANRFALARELVVGVAEERASGPRSLTFLRDIVDAGAGRDRPEGSDCEGSSATDAATAFAGGALDGLVRTLANEAPMLEARLVSTTDEAGAIAAIAKGRCPGPERLLSWSADGWSVPRARRSPIVSPGPVSRLAMRRPGALDSLHWEAAAMPSPGPGEVLIRVDAVGLNFRDVMWAQRRLPAEALELGHAGATLGMECAGVVLAVGPELAPTTDEPSPTLSDADRLKVGDRVLALASGAFVTHLAVDRRFVARLPEGLDTAEAAGIAVTGLTARYALDRLARLEAGDTLLLHGAAGGVGLAALALACQRGAQVIASAGSPAKRRLVEALGARGVVDSRHPGFADEVMALTGRRGCDVVLNSLAGEAQRRSLRCLAPFGRFVEIGKRDIFESGALPLRPFARNLSFFSFDADQLLSARPSDVAGLLRETLADHASGRLLLPPLTVMEAGSAPQAFRLLQGGGHIGKVVLRTPAATDGARTTAGPASVRRVETARPPIATPAGETVDSAGGDWLIVGGTGGLGLAIARRLAERGAGRLWLVGRRAEPGGAAMRAIDAMREKGATPILRAVDASDAVALKALMEEIASTAQPEGAPTLEGVVHAAMVLDDAPVAVMTPERVAPVLAAKMDAALLLDRATRPLAPRHFVLLGSIAARIGNPGQAAYAAANTGLEALAAWRRQQGLPAVALALGPVDDAGHLAEAPERRTRIRRAMAETFGTRLLRRAEVLAAFDAVLDDPAIPECTVVMPAGAEIDMRSLPIARLPMLADLARAGGSEDGEPALSQTDASDLAGLSPAEAREAVVALVRAALARILRMPKGEIVTDRPLAELGLDSLMAMDLKSTLEDQHGFVVPVAAIGPETTLAGLSQLLADHVAATDPTGEIAWGHGADRDAAAGEADAQHRAAAGTSVADAALADTLSAAHAAGLPAELRGELARRLSAPTPVPRPPLEREAAG